MDLLVYAHHGKMIVLMVCERKIWIVYIYIYIYFDRIFCIALNVGCSCKNGGRCIMGLGSYICECPYGYNGLSCETSKFV